MLFKQYGSTLCLTSLGFLCSYEKQHQTLNGDCILLFFFKCKRYLNAMSILLYQMKIIRVSIQPKDISFGSYANTFLGMCPPVTQDLEEPKNK